jgi:hypothetical protein
LFFSPAVNGFAQATSPSWKRAGRNCSMSNSGSCPLSRLLMTFPTMTPQENPPPVNPAAIVSPGAG